MEIEEIIEAIKDNKLYGLVSNDYYKMSKEELATILKEYIIAVETLQEGKPYTNDDIIEELEERL